MHRSNLSFRATVRLSLRCLLAVISLSCLERTIFANPITPGDILVSSMGKLSEFSLTGHLVQTISVPHPEDSITIDRQAGGVAIDSHGKVFVGNFAISHYVGQTYHAYLSEYDPATGDWQHFQHPVATTPGGTNSDIGIYQNDVFMAGYDYSTSAGTWSQLPTSVFPSGRPPADVNVGQDHLMYGMVSGSPKELVRVTDPATFGFVRDLNLRDAEGNRPYISAVAALPNGTFFAVDSNRGLILKYDPSGTLLAEVSSGTLSPLSISVGANGTVVTGSQFGQIAVTDLALDTPTHFSVGLPVNLATSYVLVVVPEPGSFCMFGAGALLIVFFRWRKHPQRRA